MSEARPELGPVATRVLFEDDHVRVWEQVIEPGESTGPHLHEVPYALVTVAGAEIEVRSVPGYPSPSPSAMRIPLASRSADLVPAGAVEEAVNTGDTPYRAILVEFKDADR